MRSLRGSAWGYSSNTALHGGRCLTSRPPGIGALLLPLLRSKGFLLVCLLSLGCTIIRETFNIWTPVYLRDYLGYTMGNAAGMSAVLPGVGAAWLFFLGATASARLPAPKGSPG